MEIGYTKNNMVDPFTFEPVQHHLVYITFDRRFVVIERIRTTNIMEDRAIQYKCSGIGISKQYSKTLYLESDIIYHKTS